jgi:hypothetical protein
MLVTISCSSMKLKQTHLLVFYLLHSFHTYEFLDRYVYIHFALSVLDLVCINKISRTSEFSKNFGGRLCNVDGC